MFLVFIKTTIMSLPQQCGMVLTNECIQSVSLKLQQLGSGPGSAPSDVHPVIVWYHVVSWVSVGLILLYYVDSIPPVGLSSYGGIKKDVQWRSLNFRFGTFQQPDFGYPYITEKIMTRTFRIILLCFFTIFIENL